MTPGRHPVQPVRVSADWLALREPADARARNGELIGALLRRWPVAEPAVVADLGCGTGSMGRWLAPQLPGAQHWVMYDRDPDLLTVAAAGMPSGTTVATRQGDITRLDPTELAGASLITASALLDMLTAIELERFVQTCFAAGCPVLVTLTVAGRVELTPADPLDDDIARAFNAHQRRTVDGRRLLGPDAAPAAVDAFARLGAEVQVGASPWRLGSDQAALAAEWLAGWVAAAVEQEPSLTGAAEEYVERRLAGAADGRLTVTVHHHDLLALPATGSDRQRSTQHDSTQQESTQQESTQQKSSRP